MEQKVEIWMKAESICLQVNEVESNGNISSLENKS